MDKSTTLKKTCMSCGVSKPLSAFLQLGGPEGTTYGTICGDCRKAGLDKPKTLHDKDGSTTSRSGNRIDAKSLLHTEIDKKLALKRNEEAYQEDREKHALKSIQKQQKNKFIASNEKKHRDSFLKKTHFSR